MRIAEQVTDHADVVVVGKLHQHDDIGAVALQRAVNGMPGAFPAVDAAAPGDLLPAHPERAASMTHPLRTPLPRAAVLAPLDPELAVSRAPPVGRVEVIRLGHWDGQAGGKIGDRAHDKGASDPKITLLTGVTIGPEQTMDT